MVVYQSLHNLDLGLGSSCEWTEEEDNGEVNENLAEWVNGEDGWCREKKENENENYKMLWVYHKIWCASHIQRSRFENQLKGLKWLIKIKLKDQNGTTNN
jgi:hypothetical protein